LEEEVDNTILRLTESEEYRILSGTTHTSIEALKAKAIEQVLGRKRTRGVTDEQ
jgi:hypothetical protein